MIETSDFFKYDQISELINNDLIQVYYLLKDLILINNEYKIFIYPSIGGSLFKNLNIQNNLFFLQFINDTANSAFVSKCFEEIMEYINILSMRVKDKCSRILVCGDINVGKSSFVNALLGLDILPVEDQPSRGIFYELSPVFFKQNELNEDVIVHASSCYSMYNISDPSTFIELKTKTPISMLHTMTEHNYFRVYFNYKKPASMLSISIIDSPGLNHNIDHSTGVFLRQQHTDCVVFVIDACNHVTLSASELLKTFASEKELIFFIINKIDLIRDKDKCKSHILKQIEFLAPQSYKNREDLIHFCQSNNHDKNNQHEENFFTIKKLLANFVLRDCILSKFLPIRNFLKNLYDDLEQLIRFNEMRLSVQICKLESEINVLSSEFVLLLEREKDLENSFKIFSDLHTQSFINEAKLACNAFLIDLKEYVENIQWTGLRNVPSFYKEVFRRIDLTIANFDKSIQQSYKIHSDAILSIISEKNPDLKEHVLKYLFVEHKSFDTETNLEKHLHNAVSLNSVLLQFNRSYLYKIPIYTFLFCFFKNTLGFKTFHFFSMFFMNEIYRFVSKKSGCLSIEIIIKTCISKSIDAHFAKNNVLNSILNFYHLNFKENTMQLMTILHSHYSKSINKIQLLLDKKSLLKRDIMKLTKYFSKYIDTVVAMKQANLDCIKTFTK